MVNNAVIIPIAVLSAIVGVSLIFVWWWFPRTWNKGNAEDRRDIDDHLQQQREILARRQEAAESEDGDVEMQNPAVKMPPIKPRNYVPPVTPY